MVLWMSLDALPSALFLRVIDARAFRHAGLVWEERFLCRRDTRKLRDDLSLVFSCIHNVVAYFPETA